MKREGRGKRAGSLQIHIGLVVLGLLLGAAAGAGFFGCGGSSNMSGPAQTDPPPAFPEFDDPPAEYRPWVRWWWPGGDVTDEELSREVAVLAENGFGGAEIQPFDAALKPDVSPDERARRTSFDTPEFYAHLAAALAAASRSGIRIDLNLASGWPTGGMHVRPEESLKTLLFSEHALEGPARQTVDLSQPDRTVFYAIAEIAETLFGERLARYEGEHARLVAVVAARVTGGERSPNPLELSDRVDLDPDSVQVLTESVDGDGRLVWDVPEGSWRIIGFFEIPDGEYPLLNAQPEPGYVADHLDSARMLSHLDHLYGPATGMNPYQGGVLAGLFNDSLELKNERLFASGFLQEFRQRRGYDLVPWFPAIPVPGADNSVYDTAAIKRGPEFGFSEEDFRVRYDYRLTVSDLYIEHFLGTVGGWVEGRGMQLRAQSYGADMDLIRAAGATHIPEAEQLFAGGAEMFLKIVSSGAMIYGRPVVSAESLVWIGRACMTTPLKIKASADKMFTSGINRVVYHGFPYRKNHDYGETGWHPFASPYGGASNYSSLLAESSPFWRFMPKVNRYIARCQYMLRQGRPEADVLVYYPWLGLPTTLAADSDHEEFLFNGRMGALEPHVPLDSLLEIGLAIGLSEKDPRARWLVERWPFLRELERNGYTWAWVNDDSLRTARMEADGIAVGATACKAVVVAEAPSMQADAAGRLAELAEQGAVVLLAGQAPSRQPGFHDHEQGDQDVAGAMGRVVAAPFTAVLDPQEGASGVLAELGVVPAVVFESGGDVVRTIRRDVNGGGRILFFRNPSPDPVEASFTLDGGSPGDAVWVDAWSGSVASAIRDGDGVCRVVLPAYGSGFLVQGVPPPDVSTGPGSAAPRGGPRETVTPEGWTLSVEGADVPGGSVRLELSSLPDWRDLEALRYSSSPGVYRARAELSATTAGRTAWLNVGWVHGAAAVEVNGQEAGILLAPPFALDVSRQVVPGMNTLEITVIPALRNRLQGYARAGDERYRQYDGSDDMLLPGGIEGPVTLEFR